MKREFHKRWRFAAEKKKERKKVARVEGENGRIMRPRCSFSVLGILAPE